MKRILIYKKIVENGEYDLFHSIDYTRLDQTIDTCYHGISPNWANRLWLQGILSEIYDPQNVYSFVTEEMSGDYINNNYDLIVLPMANIFWPGHIMAIENLAEIFEQIRIPTFVIACGVQADSYDALDDVVKQLRPSATRFIRAIYQTGGEFALRGAFTKEFFEKLGFRSAVITGCPSLFQCGRDLKIEFTPIEEASFKPVFNGKIEGVRAFLSYYPESEYFDQCNYFDLIYRPGLWKDGSPSALKRLVRRFGFDAVQLAADSRIQLFPEMPCWSQYMKEQCFSFSFGSRIHGNVMSILSDIPAIVWACDSRTREMAEFFDIPHIFEVPKPSDLYELYASADYQFFNQKFPQRYEEFEKFLSRCGIIDKINDHNLFFDYSKKNHPAFLPTPKVDISNQLSKNKRYYILDAIVYHFMQNCKSRICK